MAKEYRQARKLTYKAGKTAMKRASNRVSMGISSTNIILKAQAVNTIVSAVNNHRFQVFPLTVVEVEEMWKIARKCCGQRGTWRAEKSPNTRSATTR